MKKNKWNRTSISRWHKETFPNNSTLQQRIKCDKEAAEYLQAQTYAERIGELADFYIANCVLAQRYSVSSGILSCMLVEDSPWWQDVMTAVQDKMEVNTQRSWKFEGGEWRHSDGTTGQ